MYLYIIRHGDPDYEKDCLTQRGWAHAEAVAYRLKRSGITRVFSSPMGRARQTAQPTCRLLNLPCEIEEWAREISLDVRTPFPDGTIRSISRLPKHYFRENGAQDLSYEECCACPALSDTSMYEARRKIENASRGFLSRLGYQEVNGVYRILFESEERVAMFCHGALGRAWISVMLHIPLNIMWCSEYTHTGVTILRFANEPGGFTAPALLCYADMSHLYAHGPDMRCNNQELI